jgi:hypothetical protein
VSLLKPRRKPLNLTIRALNAATAPENRSPRSIDTNLSTAVGAVDVAALKIPIINRRGRVVILP